MSTNGFRVVSLLTLTFSLATAATAHPAGILKSPAVDPRRGTDQQKGRPPPPAQKPVPAGAKRTVLPDPGSPGLGHMPLEQAIRTRRSLREYGDDALTLKELSFLLWATQGVSKVERNEEGHIVNQFRTVPSGGARHPFETYLLVNRVEGLTPGVYRYLPLEHELMLVRAEQALAQTITDACYGRAFVGQAAVVFAWAAVPARTEWRYGQMAHRMIAIEAGHVCQNLYLAAESITAGACALLAYDQARMDALLGVDGKAEFTVYLAAVGKRQE